MKKSIRLFSMLLSLIMIFSSFSGISIIANASTMPSCNSIKASRITTSSARVDFNIKNPSKLKIEKCGMQIRKKGDTSWTTKNETIASKNQKLSTIPIYYTVGKKKEFNYTLSKKATYEYRGFCKYNGKTYCTSTKTFTTKETNYSSDYRCWSQGKSENSWMKEYGCGIVAYSKLIKESGINTSSSFNPDVYYKYCCKNGYVDKGGFTLSNGENALKAYAKEFGYTVSIVSPSGNSNNKKAINSAKSGYYTICSTGGHYVMINNAKTKVAKNDKSDNIFIYDSWNSSNNPPAVMTLSGKNASGNNISGVSSKNIKKIIAFKVNKNATEKTTTKNTTIQKSTTTNKVTTTQASTSASMSVNSVSMLGNTSAQLNFTINNPKNEKITKCGVMISKDGSNWMTLTENVNSKYVTESKIPTWYSVGSGKELDYSLTKNTTYYYKGFFITSKNVKKYTSQSSFKTTNVVITSNGVTSLSSSSATIKFTTTGGSKYGVTQAGVRIKKASSSDWEKNYTENVAAKYQYYSSLPTTYVICKNSKEVNYTLSSKTKYAYQPWVKVNGIKYYGSVQYFTTK